jgi:glycerophosphoryl diester phosphodiesterase
MKFPLIIAHRGASHRAPENTLAALKLAWEEQADAVEIDAQLSRDGKIVVIHDRNTWRAGRWPVPVRWQSSAMLKRLDVGKHLSGAAFAGERIPFLEEVLAATPASKGVVIEIKCGPEIIAPLRTAMQTYPPISQNIQFISFHKNVIAEIKQRLPEYRSQLLIEFQFDGNKQNWTPHPDQVIESARHVSADGLGLMNCAAVDEDLVRKIRENSLEFYVWTVNDAGSARRLMRLGADGITTDRPLWLRDTLFGQTE